MHLPCLFCIVTIIRNLWVLKIHMELSFRVKSPNGLSFSKYDCSVSILVQIYIFLCFKPVIWQYHGNSSHLDNSHHYCSHHDSCYYDCSHHDLSYHAWQWLPWQQSPATNMTKVNNDNNNNNHNNNNNNNNNNGTFQKNPRGSSSSIETI